MRSNIALFKVSGPVPCSARAQAVLVLVQTGSAINTAESRFSSGNSGEKQIYIYIYIFMEE